MSEFKPDIKLKPKTHPLIASLPDFLKDPKNFIPIQRKILKTLETKCSHSDVLEFAKCPVCTENMLKRRKILRDLGFKNPAQYFAWRRVHESIAQRFPLVDWDKKFTA